MDGTNTLLRPALSVFIGRRLSTAVLACCTVLLVCAPVFAEEVFAVLSSDAAPYETAAEALKKELNQGGVKVRTYDLKDFDDDVLKKALTDETTRFVAIGSDAAVALHKRVPGSHVLIYCMVADPVGLGLTAGRVSHGVDTLVPLKTQIELIDEALPKAHVLGILYRSDSVESVKLQQAVKAVLPAGWSLEAIAADKSSSMSKAVDTLFERKIDVVWTAPDSSLYDQATVRSLLLASLRRKIPVFGYSLAFVKAGALLGVAIDPQTQGKQAASLLDRVRAGKVAAPVVEAPEFEIAVNLIVAERISVNLPDKLILRTKQLIKAK